MTLKLREFHVQLMLRAFPFLMNVVTNFIPVLSLSESRLWSLGNRQLGTENGTINCYNNFFVLVLIVLNIRIILSLQFQNLRGLVQHVYFNLIYFFNQFSKFFVDRKVNITCEYVLLSSYPSAKFQGYFSPFE